MTETNKPAYRITDLHEAERPRERLASLGPQALSNAELIAILLRVGVTGENAVQMGQRLLQEFGSLNGLHRATVLEALVLLVATTVLDTVVVPLLLAAILLIGAAASGCGVDCIASATVTRAIGFAPRPRRMSMPRRRSFSV